MPLKVKTAEAAGGPANAAEPIPAHTHEATLDDEGNGLTDTVEGHRHTVKAWKVLESMGHDHGTIDQKARDAHRFTAPLSAEEVRMLYPDFDDEQATAWITAYEKAEELCLLNGPEPEDMDAAGYDRDKACRMQAARIAREAAWRIRYGEPRHYRAGAFQLPTVLADAKHTFDEQNLIEGKPVQILKVGQFDHPNSGEFEITEEFLDQLVANADKVGKQIHFDYEHASEHDSGNPAQTGKAAGWIKKLFRDGDTLWAVPLWTKPAFESIAAGEWRYTSAAFTNAYVVEGKNPIGPTLTSVAITNHPFLRGMAPIAANERGEYRWLLMAAANQESSTMKISLSDKILQLLGLGSDATEEQAEQALSSKLTEHASLAQEKTKLTGQVKAFLTALTQVLSDLGADAPAELDETADPEALKQAVAAAQKGLSIKLTEKGAKVPDGHRLVDEQTLTTLKEGAAKAEAASKELAEMRADEAIRKLTGERKIWNAEQKAFGRALYLSDRKQFDSWAKTLTANEKLKDLETRRGHGQDPDHRLTDEQQEVVKAFSAKVAEIAEKETSGNHGQAVRLAEQRYPDLARRYTDATQPAQQRTA